MVMVRPAIVGPSSWAGEGDVTFRLYPKQDPPLIMNGPDAEAGHVEEHRRVPAERLSGGPIGKRRIRMWMKRLAILTILTLLGPGDWTRAGTLIIGDYNGPPEPNASPSTDNPEHR